MNRAGNERTGNRMLNIPVKGGAEQIGRASCRERVFWVV